MLLRSATRPLLGYHRHAAARAAVLRWGALDGVGRAGYRAKVAGDNESGHIEAGENERMLFVDSEYEGSLWCLERVHVLLLTLGIRLRLRRCLPSKASLPHMASIC